MDKEQQKKLLTEIMDADAKDGLYKKQTAVEWLIKELNLEGYDYTIEQAKQMEKEQSVKFGKMVADRWGMITIPESIIEQYYNETYGE